MDIKTIILITVGLITIGAMIYCIMRDNGNNTEQQKNTSTQSLEIVDDQSESNYDTVDETHKNTGEESVYDSV